MTKILVALLVTAAATLAAGAHAQTLSDAALVKSLRQGGYVLLMRHAASPMTLPDAALAEPDNPKHERQLDAEGKATAIAMGQAFKALALPVGRVLSSPTYRAQQTARLAQFPAPELAPELGDNNQGMQTVAGGQGDWLRAKVAEPPRAGTDTILLTHVPNIRAAFADQGAGLADGETLVFRPDGKGGEAFVGRVKIEDWPKLAAQH
jgi:phosphohistidine phosphatase SixA